MDGKVFTKETKELIVNLADELVEAPIYIEPFDGVAFRILVNLIDKYGDKVIPDEFDEAINDSVLLALAGEYEAAAAVIGEAIDAVVDIPYIEDDIEALVFIDGAKFLVRIIQHWIESKKKGS